jgi:glutaminase
VPGKHSYIYGRSGVRSRNASRRRPGLVVLAGLMALVVSDVGLARGPKGARDADMQTAVSQAHKRYKPDQSGTIPDLVPRLSQVSPELYGVVVVRVNGKIFEAGDTRVPFVLTAVATPFTAALVAEQQGGAGTGNPLDWEGSIATVSLVKPQHDPDAKWRALLGNLGAFAGRELFLDDSMYRSASAATESVLEAARRLASQGRLQDDADATAALFVKQGAVTVTARDLAIMAATLANDGRNPVNGNSVVKPEVSQSLQALISTSGLQKVGMTAVAGKCGAIIAIVPGRMGIATYSPPLDAAGNSVRGQRAIKYLSQALQVSLPQN